MSCRLEANEGEPRVRALGWCYEHKICCGYQPQRKSIKIRAKNGEIIDLADIRKEQVYIGNPYSVEIAILIKYNNALLDALEAGCNVAAQYTHPIESAYQAGWNACRRAQCEAIGVIEPNAGFSEDGLTVLNMLAEHCLMKGEVT
jgi:hypothetical protein